MGHVGLGWLPFLLSGSLKGVFAEQESWKPRSHCSRQWLMPENKGQAGYVRTRSWRGAAQGLDLKGSRALAQRALALTWSLQARTLLASACVSRVQADRTR